MGDPPLRLVFGFHDLERKLAHRPRSAQGESKAREFHFKDLAEAGGSLGGGEAWGFFGCEARRWTSGHPMGHLHPLQGCAKPQTPAALAAQVWRTRDLNKEFLILCLPAGLCSPGEAFSIALASLRDSQNWR